MNKLKIIIGGVILAWIQTTVSASLCTNIYYPVCWEDGKTYTNMCFLNEAEIDLKEMWTCSWVKSSNEKKIKNAQEKWESKTAKEITSEEKYLIKLDNFFAGKNYDISEKIEILNSLIIKIEKDSSLSNKSKQFYKNVISKYKLNLETIIIDAEQEKTAKKEKEDELKKETWTDSVTLDKKEENEPFKEYTAKNISSEKLKLFVRYIRDNLWVRPLNWQRITALSIIWKKVENWVTKNYTIYTVTEYYKDSKWEIHKGNTLEWVAIILSSEKDWKIELLEYLEPRNGQFYYQDYIKLFPIKLREKLDKESDFYKETISELKEVNQKSAQKYYGIKKD